MLVLNVIQELDLYVISTIVIQTLHLELIDHVTDLLPLQRLFVAGICQVSDSFPVIYQEVKTDINIMLELQYNFISITWMLSLYARDTSVE